jgi:hypothetical protein
MTSTQIDAAVMRVTRSNRASPVQGRVWASVSVSVLSGWLVVTRLGPRIWDVIALRFGEGAILLTPSLRVGPLRLRMTAAGNNSGVPVGSALHTSGRRRSAGDVGDLDRDRHADVDAGVRGSRRVGLSRRSPAPTATLRLRVDLRSRCSRDRCRHVGALHVVPEAISSPVASSCSADLFRVSGTLSSRALDLSGLGGPSAREFMFQSLIRAF